MRRLCYRRISGRELLFLGLELVDLLILQVTLMILLSVTGSLLLTLPLVVGIYFLIRFFKKNKPRAYTERLIRFLLRPRRFNLPSCDSGEVREA